jgi:hypothetical protein
VVEILKEQLAFLGARADYVWPSSLAGARNGGPTLSHLAASTMLMYLQRTLGLNATVHGFRASFRTWADDQFVSGFTHPDIAEQVDGLAMPKYHRHAVEFCLAHNPGNRVESAYRRGMMLKARMVIMRDWANYLLPPPATVANVLPFKREQVQ